MTQTPFKVQNSKVCRGSNACYPVFRYSALMLGICASFMSLNSHARVDNEKINDTTSASLDSPEQIERLLADFDIEAIGDFSAPVARLDDNTAPLGLDPALEQVATTLPATTPRDSSLYSEVQSSIDTRVDPPVARQRDLANQPVAVTSATQADTIIPDVAQTNTAPSDITSDITNDITNSSTNRGFNTNVASRTATAVESKQGVSEQVVSETASTGQVDPDEDITNSSHPDFATDIIANGEGDSGLLEGLALDNMGLDGNIDEGDIAGVGASSSTATVRAALTPSNGSDNGRNTDNDSNDANTNANINPEDYLPEYKDDNTAEAIATQNALEEATESAQQVDGNSEGFFKRLYNRIFNEGVGALPRVNATVYLQDESRVTEEGSPVLVKADDNEQPINNIKAAIENITVQAISNFPAALPELNNQALSAARAVGYYDIALHFEKVSAGNVNIIIERLGEPVVVDNRIVDVRGEGTELDAFVAVEENGLPLEGDIFNHREYETTKLAIDTISEDYGYFDGSWLNSSVDVILPDNTADIALVYNSEQRYDFGPVIFYTLDQDTNELTRDPDKLPVNPRLLHQLYDFESGDPYYRPLITRFSNDLLSTQYFNIVNVDTVMPANLPNNSLSALNGNADEANSDSADNETGNLVAQGSQSAVTGDSNGLNLNDANTNLEDGIEPAQPTQAKLREEETDIEPIQFNVDEETISKLQAIKAKANRLITLPDNRVLGGTTEEAENFLGKISNAISNVVRKILPDDPNPLVVVDEDFEPAVLEGRITPQEVLEEKVVPIYVFVVTDKPRDAEFGIGYGTDTGVRFVGQLQHNLINRNGYQAGIRVGVSDIRKTVNIEASRPWGHPIDDTLHANLAYEQESLNRGEGALDLETESIIVGIARNIRPDSGWDRTYSLRYRLDELESGIEGARREDLPEPFNRRDARFTQQALLLGYSLHKVQSDNITDPTHGFSQYYSLEVGSDSLLTDTNMAIVRARLGTVQSFGESERHQVVASLDTGYIWADDFISVPYQQRFFAGGDRSLRGYDYHSLSAIDNGFLVGGQVLAVGSAEYNYEFKPNFRGAVFADFGNAYDSDFTTETKLGIGTGIRWSSPVGLVRLDVAAGVLEDSIPVRLHFFIGSPLP